jgi:hypothetical protein
MSFPDDGPHTNYRTDRRTMTTALTGDRSPAAANSALAALYNVVNW